MHKMSTTTIGCPGVHIYNLVTNRCRLCVDFWSGSTE